jgi:TonB family protein
MARCSISVCLALAFCAAPPHAGAQARADGVRAYVPFLAPLKQTQPDYPAAARPEGVEGEVHLLVTLDAQGNVTGAEPLAGPAVLRAAAVAAVKQWKFRPVIRDGQPVRAMTDQFVLFFDLQNPKGGRTRTPNFEEQEAADARLMDLERQLPRSPEQKLADLEQDSGGGDAMRRFYALNRLAKAALDSNAAGAAAKAAAYADELLAAAEQHPSDWNYGNALHDGHTVLGRLALRRGDMAAARDQLLASARTPGSPQLRSLGPTMRLAKDLLDKGEKDAVIEYLTLCGNFWTTGAINLSAWSQAIRDGRTPDFGLSLR